MASGSVQVISVGCCAVHILVLQAILTLCNLVQPLAGDQILPKGICDKVFPWIWPVPWSGGSCWHTGQRWQAIPCRCSV